MPGSLVATGCSPSRMKAMVEDVSEATKPLLAPTGLERVSEATKPLSAPTGLEWVSEA